MKFFFGVCKKIENKSFSGPHSKSSLIHRMERNIRYIQNQPAGSLLGDQHRCPCGNTPVGSTSDQHPSGSKSDQRIRASVSSQRRDATVSASSSGPLFAAALALPSAIPEEQSRAECVDVTELMRLMNTFATWCPCSDVHKISVLLYGIIYKRKPSTVAEAGKCLELVKSSIKTMGIAGPEWFKQSCPAYSTLKKMRNESSHATMVPEPDYDVVISLLRTVISSYHEHYFVSEFDKHEWVARPFHERNCHDPKCPKREECLKQQQEYLRPSASCVAASAECKKMIAGCKEEYSAMVAKKQAEANEEYYNQIIRAEENKRYAAAKRKENEKKQREEYLKKNPPNVDWDIESLDYSNPPNPIFARQDLQDFDLYNRGRIWETLLKESLKRKDFRQHTPGNQRQILDMYINELGNAIHNCTDYDELCLLKRAIQYIWRSSKDKMEKPELMQGAFEGVEFAWWKKDIALDPAPRNGKKKYSFCMLMAGEVDAEYYFWRLPSDVRKAKLENGEITVRFTA